MTPFEQTGPSETSPRVAACLLPRALIFETQSRLRVLIYFSHLAQAKLKELNL